MLFKVLRAVVLFDGRAYSELEEGSDYLFQSLFIAGAAAAAFGISLRSEDFPGLEESSGVLSFMGTQNLAMLLGIATYIVAWILWSALAFTIGTRLLGGKASFRRLLRVIGVAFAPGILLILRPVPAIGIPATNIALLWLLVATTVAVHYAQGYDWVRSTIATLLGWIVALIILPWLIFGSLATQPVA